MFNKKKQKDTKISELQKRLREFLLDTQSNHSYEYTLLLGCSPLSDELQGHEIDESDKRTERIAYLNKYLFAYSHTLSEATVDYYRASTGKDILPDEAWRQTRKLIDQVSLEVLLGAISQLVDMGLLEIPRSKR